MSDERVVFFFLGDRVFDPKVIGERIAAGQQSLAIENTIALGPRHGDPFALPLFELDGFALPGLKPRRQFIVCIDIGEMACCGSCATSQLESRRRMRRAASPAEKRIVGVSFPLLHTRFTGSPLFWQFATSRVLPS
jgi:hypothetical protein